MHSALKMTPELLSERPIQRVIRKTADYFSGAISERVPPKMADALRKDLYIFSGFRTYHELKESAERLLRPDGSLKSFSEFYNDTLKVRDKYNKSWLKAEYNYAVRTADAAARWAEIEKDKEHIDLLYETVGDSNVRPDHAALEGVCLPVDDPFWTLAYPPNGWNCRCRVLRVAKGSHPYSNSDEATEAFIESTSGKSELFRYNPGKEQRIFSDKHPYYSKRGIRHCAINGDKLAANLDKNEECEVLQSVLQNKKIVERGISRNETRKQAREIIPKDGLSIKIQSGEIEQVLLTYQNVRTITGKPNNHDKERNEFLIRVAKDKELKDAVYLGSSPDFKGDEYRGHSVVKKWHYYKVKMGTHYGYLSVREKEDGVVDFHSIQDEEHFSLDKIKNKAK